MVPILASLSSTNTSSPLAPELVGFATCPSCHTADQSMTSLAVSAGADWHCARCGQQWDAVRLATAAAYAGWVVDHAAPSVDPSRPM